MIEVMISVLILTMCCGMLTHTLTATATHRRVNGERAIAAEAARGVLEDMHNWNFGAVYLLYNDDPADDPDGAGTGPGKHFQVEGLTPDPDDPDGFVGEIQFPSDMAPLREDVQNELLCMPRDLNGDKVIDAEDHSLDYVVLPVTVTVHWRGRAGVRTFEMHTMLAQMEKAE